MKTSAQELLQNELSRRISLNPRYSLRAFASALRISPATLSLILSGRMPVSKKTIQKMSQSMNLTPAQLDQLMSQSGSSRTSVLPEVPMSYPHVTMDIFRILSDWYHYAILSLLELPGSSISPHWVSRKLGISVTEAKLALDRLQRMEMIEEVNGRWRQTKNPIRLPDNAKSTIAARRFQKQMIMKALNSLENDQYDRRDMTTITFPMNSKQIKRVREKITQFRRAIAQEFEKSKSKDTVYTLAIQFFPLIKTSEEDL